MGKGAGPQWPPHIKSTGGHLAAVRYRPRRDPFPWLTQNILRHVVSAGSCGRGPTAELVPGEAAGTGVPSETPVSTPSVGLITIFPVPAVPFICRPSLASGCSHPAEWRAGGGGLRTEPGGGGVGKGRINIRERERGIFISVSELSRSDNGSGAEVETEERISFFPLLQLRWLYSSRLFSEFSCVHDWSSASEGVSRRSRLIISKALNET